MNIYQLKTIITNDNAYKSNFTITHKFFFFNRNHNSFEKDKLYDGWKHLLHTKPTTNKYLE